jgi:restriction system protein
MTKRFEKQYNREDNLEDIILKIGIIYLFFLAFEYFTNRNSFWQWLIYGVVLIVLFLLVIFILNKIKEKKRTNILIRIHNAGLDDYIKNFVRRFGIGEGKSKDCWERRNYKIDLDRIADLKIILSEKNINLSASEVEDVLSFFIDIHEFNVTRENIGKSKINDFSKLSGSDFEILLNRLYEAMDFTVKLNGKTGDQGGDLIAVKDRERILIQAKCYIKNETVGNKAIQEAVAARNHYDCNKAIVITTSNFTKEAIELAKTNMVELIPKKLLQEILLKYLKESWN